MWTATSPPNRPIMGVHLACEQALLFGQRSEPLENARASAVYFSRYPPNRELSRRLVSISISQLVRYMPGFARPSWTLLKDFADFNRVSNNKASNPLHYSNPGEALKGGLGCASEKAFKLARPCLRQKLLISLPCLRQDRDTTF